MAFVVACVASGVLAQPPQAQLRGNRGGVPGQMLFRVVNHAPFPATLVNCASNFTVGASHAETKSYASFAALANTSFFWVVPKGRSVDCAIGCPECFYVAFGLEAAGGLVMRLGFETNANDDEPSNNDTDDEPSNNDTSGLGEKAGVSGAPDGAVTGLELVVSRANDGVRDSATCGPSFCAPDWERDHVVAWNTAIDLVITGSSEMEGTTTPNNLGSIASLGRWVRRTVWRGGGGGVRRTVWRGGGGGYRPPVWRRPVWHRPIYPVVPCQICSHVCYWRCR